MALFELDDVFTYQDANDIKKLWADTTAPENPAEGEVWLDISASPLRLKRYNGSDWEVIAGMSASELLESVKAVDGSGSGLDADQLDGQEGSFYRDAANFNAGNLARARLGDLWRDNIEDVETSPYILTGTEYTPAVPDTITFEYAFTVTPKAVAAPESCYRICGISTCTTTSLAVTVGDSAGNKTGGYYNWLVIGQRT
jgi:hypothetical protein